VRIGAGIALFLASSVLYVMGLGEGSLTVLYPMVSLGYVWTLLWSRLFFGEPFNREKIVGLMLALLGVFCIGLGNR
jgi:drug/metabolite transporter (DMT)-like permease